MDTSSSNSSNRVVRAGVELGFINAADDSPLFRATLQRNEDELEELHQILETVVRSSRSCLEHAASTALLDGLESQRVHRIGRFSWKTRPSNQQDDRINNFWYIQNIYLKDSTVVGRGIKDSNVFEDYYRIC